MGPCSLWEVPIVESCRCAKGQRRKKWYELNYPIDDVVIFGEEMLKSIQEIREMPFLCIKKWNQIKSCKKHKCQRQCCPVTQPNDPSGAHICLETCDKDLACGLHKCTAFCHTGICEPWAVYSNQALYCPWGSVSIHPPVRCGQKPFCTKKWTKVHEDCGHKCGQQCHFGPCPPCTEGVSKRWMCNKMELDNVKCGDQEVSCGQICDVKMPCEHRWRKMCHDHEAFMATGDVDKGCGQKWNKKRQRCEHKWQFKCHANEPCPDSPCEAESKIFCKCGYRFIVGICNRCIEGYDESEEQKIECNSEWVKNKRDSQIAKAFASKDEKKQKELRADYYPETLIDFAKDNIKFVVKLEKILEEVVKKQYSTSLPDFDPSFKKYISTLVREHYFLDMCTYGGRGKSKKVTDVSYKDENSEVPSTLLSDYVKMIKKGIVWEDAEERKNKLFEASIKISELPIGGSLEDIKINLIGFHSEFYTEKIGIRGGFYLHFYNKYRAEEAFKKLRNSGGGYSYVNLIDHTDDKEKKSMKGGKKKKKKKEFDFEGFMEV
jgi:hypothetical protein